MYPLSVIMSVFNGEEYLQEAVESIISQTFTNFEFIIVNDGSTDDTAYILNQIKDSRVKIIHMKENRGAANCLNYAVRLSSGNWIAVQDADDISLVSRLEKQLDYIKQYPETVAVGSLVESFTDLNQVSEEKLIFQNSYFNSFLSNKAMRSNRYKYCPFCHGSVLFSREAFRKVGGYNARYKIAYDYDLWLRLLQKGKFSKLPEALYRYRIHKKSLSHKNWEKTFIEKKIICTTDIRNHYFDNYGRKKPRFVVTGNAKKCDLFKKSVESKSKLFISDYAYEFSLNDLSTAYRLFKRGKLEGILILDDTESTDAIEFLERKNMKRNKNLFVL